MEESPGVLGVEFLRGTAAQRQTSASDQLKFGAGKASPNRANEERYGADVWLDEGQSELKRRRKHGWQEMPSSCRDRTERQNSGDNRDTYGGMDAMLYLAQSHGGVSQLDSREIQMIRNSATICTCNVI